MKKKSIMVFLFCFFLALPTVLYADISSSERAALIALYNSTSGVSWTNNTNWNGVAGTECTWYGITCSGNTTVFEIDLYNNNLVGTIPSELGDLSNLARLKMENNSLSGSVPSDLGNLSNLTNLELGLNSLSGNIPSQLGNLSSIERLYLYMNFLDGSIPTELGSLSNLQYLFLDSNYLSGSIPSELGSLSNLRYLFLQSNNDLTGNIPSQLGSLTGLEYLSLNDNDLWGRIPSELINLTNLVDDGCDFCGNHLFTTESALSDFLDLKQYGGDWAGCQTKPFTRSQPCINSLLLR